MSTNEREPWMISDDEFMTWLNLAANALCRVDIDALTDDELREHLGVVSALMRLVDQQLSRVADSVRERGFAIDESAAASVESPDINGGPRDSPNQRPRGKAPP